MEKNKEKLGIMPNAFNRWFAVIPERLK